MKPVLPGLPAGAAPFVIAEAGVNHNGQLDLARGLVDAAVEAGADAIKFQTFEPDLIASPEAPLADYQRRLGGNDSQLDMIRKLALDRDGFSAIAAYCTQRGILFLSTPFDRPSADFLHKIAVPVFKVASGEITNLPFLRYLSRLQRPLIVSTGMSTMGEVERAVATIEAAGCATYALLHCTSNYPAQPENANLLAISTLRETFGCPIGYSDHTDGPDVAIAAVALGAEIIEKHLTVDRKLPGPDHLASSEPAEFKAMIQSLRRVAAARGHGEKRPSDEELAVAAVARRSLAAARDLDAGAEIAESDLIELRPASGMEPFESGLIGRRLRQAVPARTLLRWGMVE